VKRVVAAATLFCAGLGLGSAGCGPAAEAEAAPIPDNDRPKQLVELLSWWNAPGEAEALEALIEVHRAVHQNARVFNTAVLGSTARDILNGRLARHDPPDLFQEYVHDRKNTVDQPPGRPVALDGLFDELGLRSVIFPEVLADVTSDGHIFAMPVDVHRENTLFYNQKLFAANNLSPPRTLDQLLEACKTLKAAGVTPIATADQGWILRIMFNTLAMGKMGSVRYHDFFTGKGLVDVTLLREVIKVFANILENYTNADAGEEGFTWTTAAQAVYNGDAAMFLHGDWVKGYLVQLGWRPGVDFGSVAAPGAGDLFLYGIDAFALPQGAKNEAGALDFLATVASTAGQAAFNNFKGSSPIRGDVPRAQMDELARATLYDLEHAKIRMLVRTRPAWEDALVAFAKDKNQAALLRAFIAAPFSP
jgi:glucose/mannose transport system substrate-binding protein